MIKAKVTTVNKIRKRDGTIVAFDAQKIEEAINKALVATKTGSRKLASELTLEVVERINVAFSHGIPSVENVQDIVEEVLMAKGYHDVAKAYILYREQRADIRRLKGIIGIRDDLKLGINALKVLERRHLLRDQEGRLIETPGELFHRVAHSIAAVETRFSPSADIHDLEDKFFNLLNSQEFMPNTPTLMNAGASLGQLSACFVLPVEDSIVEIFDSLKNMAL